jgi:hypothetical protein
MAVCRCQARRPTPDACNLAICRHRVWRRKPRHPRTGPRRRLANLVNENGAPEEIRARNPQIRSLDIPSGFKGEICKPSPIAPECDQRVRQSVANRNSRARGGAARPAQLSRAPEPALGPELTRPSTTIAAKLQEHFARGGSAVDAVRNKPSPPSMRALLRQFGARASAAIWRTWCRLWQPLESLVHCERIALAMPSHHVWLCLAAARAQSCVTCRTNLVSNEAVHADAQGTKA